MSVKPRVTRALALLATAGVVLVGCGDDSDESPDTAQANEQVVQEEASAGAAQQLETYLKKNTKDLESDFTDAGVISFVEPSDGKLKIWTFLNHEVPSDNADAKARKVCRLAAASEVSEAKGAQVVAGDGLELARC